MKLPRKDFFETIKGNKEFFRYLNSKSYIILNEVVDETGLRYDALHSRIRYWELHGYIEKVSIATLGGPRYKYVFTKEAKEILEEFL